MEPVVIIGAGYSGLLTANLLARKGVPFIGLEKSDRLGGRADTGHHRFHEESSTRFLSDFFEGLEWEHVSEPPKERRKGEWNDVSTEHMAESETFYLGASYFHPKGDADALVVKLVKEVGDKFQTQKTVTTILSASNEIRCQDGTTYKYSKLIWCAEIEQLAKLWDGDKLELMRALKNQPETHGGINLELELKEPAFDNRNTIVFPFRYKSFHLRALGVASGKHLNWMLFLREGIGEDREEIAKCLRALKRELHKEFPQLAELTLKERISFFSTLSGESPVELPSLDVLGNVIYVGPEARPKDSHLTLKNLDRITENCRFAEPLL